MDPAAILGGPTEPTEIEVKLGVEDPRPLRALLRAPDPERLAGFEADGGAIVVRLTDRYLDTAPWGGLLEQSGYRARLRRTGHAIELTVKRRGEIRGDVTERLELKGAATRSRIAARWPPSTARDRVAAIAGSVGLLEVAALRQERLVRRLRRGTTEVEVSLDALEALVGRRVAARRWEVEAELVGGDRGPLDELALALRRVPGVRDPLGSKLEFAKSGRSNGAAATGSR
jgi:inorganic triphosphatase YgiF